MVTWHRLVVSGSDQALRAFVAGLEDASGASLSFVIGRDLDLASPSLAGWLRELLEHGTHQQVFAPSTAADLLCEALERRGAEAELELHSRSVVESTWFRFSARAFSEDVAGTIRDALVEHLPEGVRVEGLDESVERDPAAHGAELYAPEHEYTYSVSGSIVGAFPGVLEVHRRASESEFVDAEPIHVRATSSE